MTRSVKCAVSLALLGVMAVGAVWAATAPRRGFEPPKRYHDAIAEYADQLRVGPPRHHQDLTLFPIFAPGVKVPEVDLTLDRAMEKGWLEITELAAAQVSRVRVRNRASAPVFVMGGEMLAGAKQERIVGDDLIIPAKGELTLPVFCVEHGRWSGETASFKSAGAMAGSAVRKARARADQGLVWSEVAREQERLQAPSVTGAYGSVPASPAVQERIKPYTRRFLDLPDEFPKARGVVATVRGEVIAADLFSSAALFRQLWPKLLESYVIDALDRPLRGRDTEARSIERWLNGLRQADRSRKDTPGQGTLYELRGAGILGSALVYQKGVVHMELFQGVFAATRDFNRLQFRRGRLGAEE